MTRAFTTQTAEPDLAQLTALGWSIISCVGPYVTVWRDGEEHVLLWRDGIWLCMDGGHATEFSPHSGVTENWNN